MSGMAPTDVLNISLDDYTNVTITFSPYYQHSLFVAVIYILAYFFIFLLCMVGNTLVCCIVLENRPMRTVINLFIFNLAVSDLLVGIFCIPTTLVDNLITGASSVLPSDSPRCLRFELVVISAPKLTMDAAQYEKMFYRSSFNEATTPAVSRREEKEHFCLLRSHGLNYYSNTTVTG